MESFSINWDQIESLTSKQFVEFMQNELEREVIEKVVIHKGEKLIIVDILGLDVYSFRYSIKRDDMWHYRMFLSSLKRLGLVGNQ